MERREGISPISSQSCGPAQISLCVLEKLQLSRLLAPEKMHDRGRGKKGIPVTVEAFSSTSCHIHASKLPDWLDGDVEFHCETLNVNT